MLDIPLYRLWGGRDGKLMPYASQWSTGTPEERARMAQTVRAHNWRAIKFRSHFPTLKEDVALIEQTRKLMGDDFIILTDANQAGDAPDGANSGPVRWDYQRALTTAREYARLGLYWLEEPLPRWDFDQLAQLRHASNVRIAGGEASTGLHEYRGMLEKDSLDIIQFELTVVGPTVARQIATLAAAYDKPCVAHVGFGPGVFCAGHLNASLQNAVFFGPTHGTGPTWEVFYEPPALDIEQIWSVYENAPRIDKDGYTQLPDAPGLGVTIRKIYFRMSDRVAARSAQPRTRSIRPSGSVGTDIATPRDVKVRTVEQQRVTVGLSVVARVTSSRSRGTPRREAARISASTGI